MITPDSMGSAAIQKEQVAGPKKPFIPFKKKKGMSVKPAPMKKYTFGSAQPSDGIDFASMMRGR